MQCARERHGLEQPSSLQKGGSERCETRKTLKSRGLKEPLKDAEAVIRTTRRVPPEQAPGGALINPPSTAFASHDHNFLIIEL